MRLSLKLRTKRLTKSMLDILAILFTTQMHCYHISKKIGRYYLFSISRFSIFNYSTWLMEVYMKQFLIFVRYLKYFSNSLANSYNLIQVSVFFTRISKIYCINVSKKLLLYQKHVPFPRDFTMYSTRYYYCD